MTPTREQCVTVDLTREQSWVLHAALVEHIEAAIEGGRTPDAAIGALEHVEGGAVCLDDAQRALARDALVAYLAEAPTRDRTAGRAVLDALDAVRA